MGARNLRRLALAAAVVAASASSASAAQAAPAAAPAGAPAPAADPAARAFDEGTRSFREGRYAEAAVSYERAARLRPHPLPFVNAAEAWDRAGHVVQSATACDRALELATDVALRAKVEARLQRLLRQIGTLDIAGSGEFQVRVDGGEPLRTPARLRVSPGKHVLLMVEETSRSAAEREVLVGAGETHHIVLSASRIDVTEAVPTTSPDVRPPGQPAPTEPAAAAAAGPPLASWISFGIAGAAGVTSGVFGALTLASKNDFDARPTEASADAFDRNQLVTNIALGTAAAAALVGVVLWIVQPARPSTQVGAKASPLLLHGRF